MQSLSYKVCSVILSKFNTFGLFISILGTSAIMDQTACCHRLTTSETGLYFSYKVCSIILPKFNTFRLFIPILGTFAIMDQTACCYNVTTSETGLCSVTRCALSYYQNSIHLDCLFQFWVLPLLWTRQLVVIMWPHQKQVYTSVTRCALSYYHLDCLFQFWVLPPLWTRQLVDIMWRHQKQVYKNDVQPMQ